MFKGKQLSKETDRLRDQRDQARRQRDHLKKIARALKEKLSNELKKPLLPPYGKLCFSSAERLTTSTTLSTSSPDAESLQQPNISWPTRHLGSYQAVNPGEKIAFLTVANDRFYPGVEALLLSLRSVYPDLTSPFYIIHDGSLTGSHKQRLKDIHPNTIFEAPTPDWASLIPLDSNNRKRIGILGYLNIFALTLEGFERVIILDSDVLVLGSLDQLWAHGNAFRAMLDCGETPYADHSSYTGLPIINSGVISVPGWGLGSNLLEKVNELIRSASTPICPLLDRFADQKVWNLLLADQPLEVLPVNYNCNIKYLVQYLEGCIDGIALVHFAGPKPWLIHEQPKKRAKSIQDHWLWIRHYRSLLYQELLKQYGDYIVSSGDISAYKTHHDNAYLSLDPFWLQHQDDRGSTSCHLAIHSPNQFREPDESQPTWPEGWLEALNDLSLSTDLHIWAPYSMRYIIESAGAPPGAHCRYILLEQPFSAPDGTQLDVASFSPWKGSAASSMLSAVEWRLSRSGIHCLKIRSDQSSGFSQ